MKFVTLALASALLITAQAPTPNKTPSWRAGLASLPPAPLPTTTARDITQFEINMRMAAAYLGNTTPNANSTQWEANRALVRQMATYLYGLRAFSTNSQLQGPITHAQKSFDALGLALYLSYVNSAAAPYPDPVPQPHESAQIPPPFSLDAPELAAVSDADKGTAADLRTRYETDASHSATVWQNAEILRQNLELRGMGLNLQTATSMVRMPQYFRVAATALRRNDWDEARTRLQQAEAETEKIEKTVGR
jgi:hypothetical protein